MYVVIWGSAALQELAALWVNADAELRAAITAATEEIDLALTRFPDDVGESRPDNRRIAFARPLGVLFRVRSSDRRVIITRVWSTERPNS
jgi:hypothetical protein